MRQRHRLVARDYEHTPRGKDGRTAVPERPWLGVTVHKKALGQLTTSAATVDEAA